MIERSFFFSTATFLFSILFFPPLLCLFYPLMPSRVRIFSAALGSRPPAAFLTARVLSERTQNYFSLTLVKKKEGSYFCVNVFADNVFMT